MGRPPIFKSEEDFADKFSKYVDHIFESGFKEVVSYKGFADFIGCTSRTVYGYIMNHPKVKEMTREPYADVLVVGATKGAYKTTPAIFTLKNRCGWADKVESSSIGDDNKVATAEEAKEKILKIVEARNG